MGSRLAAIDPPKLRNIPTWTSSFFCCCVVWGFCVYLLQIFSPNPAIAGFVRTTEYLQVTPIPKSKSIHNEAK
ncbi:hypothetical protein BDV24DRAFT_136014 [Aspergillus arachidicola]|uniref:Uncharacterized protein n=1 Tax=Aspergillus arachidicola TaxID=656916 RepID=A0A5N6Y6X1_9EURO|nr:hypothetical protein BDV24DRAFT_136014 [Aspergillus arachidicola]